MGSLNSPSGRGAQIALVLAGVIFALVPWTLTLDPLWTHWLFNFGWTASPLIAAVACFHAANRVPGFPRKAWLSFGVGNMLWLGGTVAWIAYDVHGAEPPFPTVADAGYLLAAVLFIRGMFYFGFARPAASRIQICNFLIAICALGMTAFHILYPWIMASRIGSLGTTVAFLYPSLWFSTAAFGLVCHLVYAPRETRTAFAFLISGIVAQAIADLFYGLSLMGAEYEVGSFFDGFWILGFLLIAAAALEQLRLSARGVVSTTSRHTTDGQLLAEAFVPAGAVTVVLLSGLVPAVWAGHTLPLLTVPGIVAFALALGIREHWMVFTERRLRSTAQNAARALSESRGQLASILESTSDSVVVVDRNWRLRYINQRALDLIAQGRPMPVGTDVWAFFSDAVGSELHQKYLAAMHQKIGFEIEVFWESAQKWVELRAHPQPDGMATFFRDVSERRRVSDEIQYLAHHDPLTGLVNRRVFHDSLAAASTAEGSEGRVAVLCLDLDHFKDVNDSLGHAAGDALLVSVAERLSASIRPGDVLSRIGGDEFAVLSTGCKDAVQAADLAQRILDGLAPSFSLDGSQVRAGASIGVALAPARGPAPPDLLKKADIALFHAKGSGRGAYRLFEPLMEHQLCVRQALKADLAIALANSQLELAFQPIIDVETQKVRSFEALLRWHHPERGWISPAEFIPIAEETGLIVEIGAWVLDRACAEAAKWPDGIAVAVNLSPCQFGSPGLPEQVYATLSKAGLDPARLELEITETVLLRDSETNVATLHRLKALGVRIALDDFGTGYSSLAYVQRFPFDKLKIDRSFVDGLPGRDESRAIIRAVVGLGRSLGMSVTAEGVETPEQFEAIRAKSCDAAQGYLFSKPVPALAVPAVLAKLHDRQVWWTDTASRRSA